MRKSVNIALTVLLISAVSIGMLASRVKHPSHDIFAKQNLVAWCVVAFDSQNRNAVERAEMLNRLGITKLAYDWFEPQLATFGEGIDALRSHNIKLQAIWLVSGPHPETDKDVQIIFDLIKRKKLKTQIWYRLLPEHGFDQLTQEQKVTSAVEAVRYIATKAAKYGCTVGLYNHGGWYGEPEDQLAIIQQLRLKNVGMVYNFNHAQQQIDRFPEFYPKIEPHLIAINLAGLRRGDKRVYPIGDGDSEFGMIQIICSSYYRGPIGIINEHTDPDAEVGLEMNLKGLQGILGRLGDESAVRTYETP